MVEEKEFGGDLEGTMAMLKTMEKHDILQVLRQTLCSHCNSQLNTRLSARKSEQTAVSEISCLSDSTHLPAMTSTTDKTLYSSVIKSNRGSLHTPNTPNSSSSSRENKMDSYASSMFVNSTYAGQGLSQNGGRNTTSFGNMAELSEDAEKARFAQIRRKKDFVYMEKINGKSINVLQGLELHTEVFNSQEQRDIVDCVIKLQRMGQNQQLKARTYTEPRKWMRGKGRATIQFGCCYNYATDKNGNPPGILRDEEVDPMPQLFKQMVKRMVRMHVLLPSCVPDSCIVNIYEAGDCIPPHIDHHDFIRPFCTVSFLTECKILFGASLEVVSAGEFAGPVSISLPLGSVLILSGNGADVAKHCVPGVPSKRISITFRKMDKNKLPYRSLDDPELTGIKPLGFSPKTKVSSIQPQPSKKDDMCSKPGGRSEDSSNKVDFLHKDEFPPLHKLSLGSHQRRK